VSATRHLRLEQIQLVSDLVQLRGSHDLAVLPGMRWGPHGQRRVLSLERGKAGVEAELEGGIVETPIRRQVSRSKVPRDPEQAAGNDAHLDAVDPERSVPLTVSATTRHVEMSLARAASMSASETDAQCYGRISERGILEAADDAISAEDIRLWRRAEGQLSASA
jgi:hypothetical protein